MPTLNQSAITSVRQTSRKALADIAGNVQKTGKQKVREVTQKLTQKAVTKHSQQLAQFVAEEGKGSGLAKIV